MTKTINKDIDIFATESAARTAWKKTKSGHLLFAFSIHINSWFIDRSKTAFYKWPELYRLIDSK